MAEANDAMDLPLSLEIFPGASGDTTNKELEPKAARAPRLPGKGALLVLCVEGADTGEIDLLVVHDEGDVVTQVDARNLA